MKNIKYLLTLALCFCCAVAFAQKRISGRVWSKTDGPIIMANVVELDYSGRAITSTTTDINGNFSMTVRNTNNRLQVSYVGYAKFVEKIGARTSFNIQLKDVTSLSTAEVRVTRKVTSNGLTIPEREISMASQSLNMDEMEGLSFETAGEALQGQIAGLDIVMNSGNLGAGTSMRLRGVTSINGGQEPLIVVNGYILEDYSADELDLTNMEDEEQFATLLQVSPEDIQSIKVLKDASATAIWGSRGSNGVIEITTRRGSRGKTRVSFGYRFSGSWQPEGMKMLDGDGYTMMLKEAYFNPGQNDVASGIVELSYMPTHTAYYANYNNNTDWIDEVTQFGQTHNYSVAVSGGGEKAVFRISGGYDHQTGTVIGQELDRFTTRVALDYFVSDRIKFSTNFGFTYTNNIKNYDKNILARAQHMAPNMSIYRQDGNGNDLSDYYIMNKTTTTNDELKDIQEEGNPVAVANLSWAEENTYRITPDFSLQYELLGTEEGKSRLTYRGDVYFDIYAKSAPSYWPGELIKESWNNDNYNRSGNTEENRMGITVTNDLTFTPYFKNEDWTATMRFRYQTYSSNGDSQTESIAHLPTGITSSTVNSYVLSASSATSKDRWQNWSFNSHFSYKSRYNLGVSVRADGDSRFGPAHKWAYFPSVSFRWNIIDEPFMKPLRKVVSMLAFRPSWGMVGNTPNKGSIYYESYNITGNGSYGGDMQAAVMTQMKLDDLKWETTNSYNLGFNLGLFDDKIEAEFEYYYKKTTDLLMEKVNIPSTSGYAQLAYANVGAMTNEGWELNLNFNDIVKKGKFRLSANLNVAQNYNELTEMDESVLASLNTEWNRANGSYLSRVQVGNPLGSIYGLRYQGVYQYTYEYLTNLATENNWDAATFENEINSRLSKGQTFPVARDANGRVIMNSDGTPKRMVFDYSNTNYQFQGGDAIYEDINHDGEINELDIVYLGNSMPKVQGGFGITMSYGNWTLRTNFNYRFGFKVVNQARMNLQNMSGSFNQTAAVNYRWRKDGDVTPMPRAMYGTTSAYNYLGSDRYVEDAGFVRFQYFQLTYRVPAKLLKPIGLNALSIYVSGNNLFTWTKYSGTDPEHSVDGYSYATDKSNTPRSKSFTVGLNVSF